MNIADHPPGKRIQARATVLRHGGGGTFEVPVTTSDRHAQGSQLQTEAPELQKLMTERARVLARLRALVLEGGMAVQLAYNLLRTKTGGDAVFLARACGIPGNIAQQLDAQILEFMVLLSGVTDASWTQEARKRAFLPMANGGLGLSSVELMAPAAVAASWQATIPAIQERLGMESPAQLIAASPWLMKVQQDAGPALRLLLGQQDANLGDENIREFRQSEIIKLRSQQQHDALLERPGAAQRELAALRSAGGKGAGAWLNPPTEASHRYADPQWKAALATRLDLDIPGHVGTCTHLRPDGSLCGATLDPKGKHARACICQGWRSRKHDGLCGSLADWCTEQGCQVVREVLIPQASSELVEARLDLVIRAPGVAHPIYVDVTVADATALEALAKNSGGRDAAAAQVLESRKRAKYPGITMVPFAVEAHGRVGPAAMGLIRQLAPKEPRARANALASLYQGMAAVLQRTQADAVLTATRARGWATT